MVWSGHLREPASKDHGAVRKILEVCETPESDRLDNGSGHCPNAQSD